MDVLSKSALNWEAYESVSFICAEGLQHFGALSTIVRQIRLCKYPWIKFCFFLEQSDTMLKEVVTAIYQAHPYEEPVIFIQNCLRTLHIRGADIDNPNRFWNRQDVDWVPKAFDQKREQV